jgi:hypothetical protein
MSTKEILSNVDQQIEMYKEIKGIDVPVKLADIDEIAERTFEELKVKIAFGQYKILANLLGQHTYTVFNYTVSRQQKIIKNIYLFFPYVFAALFVLIGLSKGELIFVLGLFIPFISQIITGIVKTRIILPFLFVTFIYLLKQEDQNLVALAFLLIGIVSVLSGGLIKIHVKNVLRKISLMDEKIFSFLFFTSVITIYETINMEVISYKLK